MTKGKKWTLRLLGVAALALLICLCLLGSTMARYTSTGNGEGTLTVALWQLETQRVEIASSKISPSDEEYGAGTGAVTETQYARENESGWIEALKMVNNSDVAADVELDLGDGLEFTWPDSSEFTWGTGWTKYEVDGQDNDVDASGNIVSGRAQTNEYAGTIMTNMGTQAEFKTIVEKFGVLDIQLGYAENESGEDVTPLGSGTKLQLGDNTGYYGTETKSNAEYIYADVVWTSIYETNDETLLALVPAAYYANAPEKTGTIDWKSFSDDVDTILGMYVTDISFAVTWTATQASTLPPTEG